MEDEGGVVVGVQPFLRVPPETITCRWTVKDEDTRQEGRGKWNKASRLNGRDVDGKLQCGFELFGVWRIR